ncbi:MAG: Do family serine endopeptidase [candidate division KSB1 bacterium]|nr:Do family serine endopeptidase [candidate division KSB1 bacterium]
MVKSKKITWLVFLSIAVGLIAGLILASNLDWTFQSRASSTTTGVKLGSDEPVPQELLDLEKTSRAFVAIVKKVSPTVVTITSEKTVKVRHPFSDFFGEDFFRFFQLPEGDVIQRGLGSGVIVSPDGYILTNHHVIKDADELNVLIEKEEYDAKVIGSDPKTDVAVIKIDKKDLPTIKFGDSDQLEVGEIVLAIGSPFSAALERTVTHGIVSAKGRTGLQIGGAELSYQNFIQTDAAINPGNSGGALVNLQGELVGINTAIVGQANVGIGFAIPINMAKWVMEQLLDKGKVVRGWLGVYIGPVDRKMARALGLDKAEGALVSEVVEDSPAGEAGVKAGDVIIEFDGKPIKDDNHLMNLVASYDPGSRVSMKIVRDGKEKILNVKLGERPDEAVAAAPSVEEKTGLGIRVQNLTRALAERYGYKNEEGVLVTDVQ